MAEVMRGRLRRLNLVMMLPPLAVVGGVLVAVDARNWWDAGLLTLGVLAALLVIERWAAGDVSFIAFAALAVTAAVWLIGALLADSHTGFYGISIAGPIVIAHLPRFRVAAGVGLTCFVAAIGVARLLIVPSEFAVTLVLCVLLPTSIMLISTGLMFVNRVFYASIEKAREREAELAVVQERMRFASDLHDIQGHTLHVVKLKVALAEKLVRTDAVRAEEELREIRALVADTITQTKELAYAQRRINLAAELENAKNLFEAAGIRVRVERESAVDTRAGELLGQVLRETTTNILRHAQATQVRITLSKTAITIDNDGVPDVPLSRLSGLATLKERVANSGGELTVEQLAGHFRTAATLPRPA